MTNFDVGIYVNRENGRVLETDIKIEECNNTLSSVEMTNINKRAHGDDDSLPNLNLDTKRTRTNILPYINNEQLQQSNNSFVTTFGFEMDDSTLQTHDTGNYNSSPFLPLWDYSGNHTNQLSIANNAISPLEVWPGSSLDGLPCMAHMSTNQQLDFPQSNELLGDTWMGGNDQFNLMGMLLKLSFDFGFNNKLIVVLHLNKLKLFSFTTL